MPRRSAGLLPYRIGNLGLEVLLVHPGGPFWKNRDVGAWSIVKGEYEEGEDPLFVAEREFNEELGLEPPNGERRSLGEIKQAGGKYVVGWAVLGDLDTALTTSNQFEMEWPPKSGGTMQFPEIDRAEWFTLGEARLKILAGQLPFLDRIEALDETLREN